MASSMSDDVAKQRTISHMNADHRDSVCLILVFQIAPHSHERLLLWTIIFDIAMLANNTLLCRLQLLTYPVHSSQ